MPGEIIHGHLGQASVLGLGRPLLPTGASCRKPSPHLPAAPPPLPWPTQPPPGTEPGGRGPEGQVEHLHQGGSAQGTTMDRNVRAGMGLLRGVPRFFHMFWAALVQLCALS